MVREVWRVGRKIPKNLYKGNLDVGRCDLPEYAAEIVAGMNRNGKIDDLQDRIYELEQEVADLEAGNAG